MSKILKCQDVADYFLMLVNRRAGDLITQLKLQKLLYFAQGLNLAYYNRPLFHEKIESWQYGPVVRQVWQNYRGHEQEPLPAPPEMDFDLYTAEQRILMYKTFREYGEHSAEYLANETHTHPTWQEAERNQTIDQERMKFFFRAHIASQLRANFLDMSAEDDEALFIAEDEWWMKYGGGGAYWGKRATQAIEEGFLGVEAGQRLIEKFLNEEAKSK